MTIMPSSARIAICCNNFQAHLDGVSITLQKWVHYLLDQGHEICVLAAKAPVRWRTHPKLDIIELPVLPIPGRSEYGMTFWMSGSVWRRLAQFKPDLMHIATPDHAGLRCLKWSKRHHIPVVSSVHTAFPTYLRYYHVAFLQGLCWRYLDYVYRQCQRVYYTSESAKASFKLSATPGDRIWSRGVDSERFHPAKRSDRRRQEWGVTPSQPVVLWVSRLVKEKNLQLYIDAVHQARRDCPDICSVVVGDGPLRAHLERSLPNAVVCGTLEGDALAETYASADLFLFPSVTETFGNVTLEAMSSGLPVIVAEYEVNRPFIDPNRTGCWCPSHSVDAFARQLVDLIRAPHRAQKLGQQAREHALSFDQTQVHADLWSDYRSVIEARR